MAKIISLNVKGLNSNVKRRLLLTELKSQRAEIAFIQETHFNKEGNFRFLQRLYPTVYVASQERKKAGVAILISHNCPLTVTDVITDPGGRYIILQARYKDTPVILGNVYVPNTSQLPFLRRFLSKITRLPSAALLIGGDFNIAFSEVVDKLLLPGKQIHPSLSLLSRSFRQLIRKFSLYDLWRIAHPTERQYSFYSPPHSSHSRIDYFFGNVLALRRLMTVDLGLISWSDHAPISLTLDLGSVPTRVCHWRLNESLLKKPSTGKNYVVI